MATLRIDLQGGFEPTRSRSGSTRSVRREDGRDEEIHGRPGRVGAPLGGAGRPGGRRIVLPGRGIERGGRGPRRGRHVHRPPRRERPARGRAARQDPLLPLGPLVSGRRPSYPRLHAAADREQRSRRRDRLRVALQSTGSRKTVSPRCGGAPTMNRRSSSSCRFESWSAVPGWTTRTLPFASSCRSGASPSPMWIVSVPSRTTKTSSWIGSMCRRPTAPGG